MSTVPFKFQLKAATEGLERGGGREEISIKNTSRIERDGFRFERVNSLQRLLRDSWGTFVLFLRGGGGDAQQHHLFSLLFNQLLWRHSRTSHRYFLNIQIRGLATRFKGVQGIKFQWNFTYIMDNFF